MWAPVLAPGGYFRRTRLGAGQAATEGHLPGVREPIPAPRIVFVVQAVRHVLSSLPFSQITSWVRAFTR